ncbi:erg24, C-14 sterol reductase [Irineochytrium annulatum]|nr:erg24, C-14 sterol reductase [Irineochytrium annulatum]
MPSATCHDSVRKERRKGVKRGPYKHKSYRVTVSPDRASSQVRDTSSYDDQAIEKRQRSASTATTPELDPQPAEMAEETPEPAKGSAEADAAAAAAAWSKLHILSQLCSAVLDHSTKTDDGEGETEPETEAVDGTSKAAVTSTVPAPLSTEDDEVPIVKPRAVRPKSARVSKKRSAEGSPKEKAAKKQARGDGVVAETEDMDDGAEVTTNVSHIVSPTSSGSSHKVGEQPVPKGVVTRRALAGSAATIPTTTPAPSPSRGPHRDQLNGDHLQKKVMEAGMAAGRRAGEPPSKAVSEEAGEDSMNPVTRHFEFSGPYFVPVVVMGMTIAPILLYTLCDAKACPPNLPTVLADWRSYFLPLDHFSLECVLAVFTWQVLHFVLYLVLPGERVRGTLLRDGKTLIYPINGFRAMLVSACLVFAAVRSRGIAPLIWIADHYLGLAMASILLCLIYSTLLYIASFRPGKPLLALGGNSGWQFYDFFIGRELNPRFLGVDLKFMCELRPGLIGWCVLNLALAARQGRDLMVASGGGVSDAGGLAEVVEALSHATTSMWLVVLFELYYVIDALWNERSILTTMDITTDGFGFMLCYGDMAWLPFTYTLQARYLSFRPVNLGRWGACGVVMLKLVGIYMFRASNGQKNAFRTDPDGESVKHLKYIETASGRKLLVSGWWGVARHINYTADWLMALSWCLPTGFSTPVPYFYAIYFAILLWHRELRDEENCQKKYGKDWDRYCKIVRYRFIPGMDVTLK